MPLSSWPPCARSRFTPASTGSWRADPCRRIIRENPDDVLAGAANLRKQVENIQIHGVTPVVAINAFPDDHPSEHRAIRELAEHLGVRSAVCNNFAEGGAGATELAEMVAEAADEPSTF